MGSSTFSGPVTSTAGFVTGDGYGLTTGLAGNIALGAGSSISIGGIPIGGQFSKVDVTAASLTLSAATHSGKIVTMSLAAGQAYTLPAATGTGNIYRLLTLIAVTGSTTIKVANASDTMIGFSASSTFAGTGSFVEGVGGTDDTITYNGTTTGGLIGSYVYLQDFATNIWFVDARIVGSGTMATSFSATV